MAEGVDRWPEKTLIYSDPPYYAKGRHLYYDFYQPDDHERIARLIQSRVKRQRWIVSYDDVPEIRSLYGERQLLSYGIGYSARTTRKGAEIMFFDDYLQVPEVAGSMSSVEQNTLPV